MTLSASTNNLGNMCYGTSCPASFHPTQEDRFGAGSWMGPAGSKRGADALTNSEFSGFGEQHRIHKNFEDMEFLD